MPVFERHLVPPAQSFFLFGPRGTGKSTWVRSRFPSAHVVDLLAPEQHRSLSANPERLRQLVEARLEDTTFVIDEVQRVPDLLSVVHELIEKRRSIRFILTGSSARKLKRTGVDLLAGRAILKRLHPFMAGEMRDSFDLERCLRLGMLPIVHASPDPLEVLNTYAALYVREEVQAEGMVRNLSGFNRFLEIASFSHGSTLNLTNVSRECEVPRKTVESYLSILEDLLLAFRLPVFTRRAGRALTSHPKFYYVDAGLYRSLRPTGPMDRAEEIEGGALEGLVAQHLRAWIDYSPGRHSLHFWRTPSGTEVDFVVYGEGGFWAIEVKNSRKVRGADLRAIRAFREDYPEARTLLLYRGSERLMDEGVLCLPVAEFLSLLVPGAPLDAGFS